MNFGSKKTYVSQRKIERLQHKKDAPPPMPMSDLAPPAPALPSIPEEAEKKREEKPSAPRAPAGYVSAKAEAEGVSALDRKRSRSNSIESLSDEELDEFHSGEEDNSAPAPMALASESVKKKSGGGILGAIKGIFSSSPSKPAEDEKSKGKAKKAKKELREEAAMSRHHRKAPQMARKDLGLPLSAAVGAVGKHHEQEVDTNVLSLNLSVLKDKTQIATGDPIFCSSCKAMHNIHSKLVPIAGTPKSNWGCEFCGTSNEIMIDPEEMPKAEELTYILQSAHQAMMKKGGSEDISIIFCIDVSGSMCVSQPIQGKISIKYDKTAKLQDLMKFSDGSYQYTDRENRNTTYVSRMQCVQAAIEKQLGELAHGAPNRKIGIVTFNNEVTLIGDASAPSKVITGDKLGNYDLLLESAMKDADVYLTKPIKDTKEAILKKMADIEESGQTALGPALLTALGLASRGTAGSKVIICTDGLANVGLGAVDELASEAAFTQSKEFYTKVGDLAKNKGVSISIISMVGEECKLEMLNPLADLSGGDILKVDPANLTNDFANILSANIIATNVELKVKLHKGFTFRNEDPQYLSADQTLLVKELGNVADEQEVTLEYCMKPTEELAKLTDIDFTKVTKLPFQTQITYKTLDGMKCVRLITKHQDVTHEKDEAKKQANYQVLSVNAVQQTAKMAKEGKYRAAQANAYHWKKMMKGSEAYEDYMVNAAPLYGALQRQQEEEVMEAHQPAMAQQFAAFSYAPPPAPGAAAPGAAAPGMPAPMAPPQPASVNDKKKDYLVSEANQAQKMNFKKMSKK